MESTRSKRPRDTAFRQQNLKAWRPILTPKLVILLFFAVGIVFLPIGIAVMIASNQVTEVQSIDYSEACCVANCDSTSTGARVDLNPCYVNITVPTDMEPPIYMYYKMTNYYQNHRRYVKSRSDMQLRGLEVSERALNTSCEHRVLAATNSSIDDSRIISPCGLISWSVFNDSFTVFDSAGAQVPGVATTGIAWESDVQVKFRNAGGDVAVKTGSNFPHFYHERRQPCSSFPNIGANPTLLAACEAADAGWCFPGSGMCAEDEHFIVWMRTAGLPTFRKLYAKIEGHTLPAGSYTVRVHNGQHYSGPGGDFYFNPAQSAEYYDDPSGVPVSQTFLYPVRSCVAACARLPRSDRSLTRTQLPTCPPAALRYAALAARSTEH